MQIIKHNKGHIYGFGSAKYWDLEPTKTVHDFLGRNLDMDMQITSVENNLQTINNNVEAIKSDVAIVKSIVAAVRGIDKQG